MSCRLFLFAFLSFGLICNSVTNADQIESASFAGWTAHISMSGTGNLSGDALVSGPTVTYDNIAAPSAVSAASSVTDLDATWGDRVTLSDTGSFDALTLSVFNSTNGGTNLNPLTTFDLNIDVYDAATFDETDLASNTSLLSFFGSLDFSAGPLNPGFFTTIAFSGLAEAFGSDTDFSLTNSDLMITQRVSNVTGGTDRLGVAFFTEDNIGTQFDGNDNWYRDSPAAASSGYFAFAAPTSNRLGMTVGLTAVPEPSSAAVILLNGLFVLSVFRRKSGQ